MGDLIDKAQVYSFANELMFSGKKVSVQTVAELMDIEATEELGNKLEHWWMEQESLITFRHTMSPQNRPNVPETVYQSVQLIWDNALKDARLELELAVKKDAPSIVSGIALEDELYLSKSQLETLEDSNQRLRTQLTESQHNVKNLEAERAMLRSNLQSSETNVSTMSHKVAESKGEMQRAQVSRRS